MKAIAGIVLSVVALVIIVAVWIFNGVAKAGGGRLVFDGIVIPLFIILTIVVVGIGVVCFLFTRKDKDE